MRQLVKTLHDLIITYFLYKMYRVGISLPVTKGLGAESQSKEQDAPFTETEERAGDKCTVFHFINKMVSFLNVV